MQADFSHARESETLDHCENVLSHLRQLSAAIANGPRLTTRDERDFQESIMRMHARYSDIAKHCRKNLA